MFGKTAIKYLTEGQNQSLTSWTWAGWQIIGVVMTSLSARKDHFYHWHNTMLNTRCPKQKSICSDLWSQFSITKQWKNIAHIWYMKFLYLLFVQLSPHRTYYFFLRSEGESGHPRRDCEIIFFLTLTISFFSSRRANDQNINMI